MDPSEKGEFGARVKTAEEGEGLARSVLGSEGEKVTLAKLLKEIEEYRKKFENYEKTMSNIGKVLESINAKNSAANQHSNLAGVYYHTHTNKYQGSYWMAQWYTAGGQRCRRCFATNKYGEERAKTLAIKCREKGIRKTRNRRGRSRAQESTAAASGVISEKNQWICEPLPDSSTMEERVDDINCLLVAAHQTMLMLLDSLISQCTKIMQSQGSAGCGGDREKTESADSDKCERLVERLRRQTAVLKKVVPWKDQSILFPYLEKLRKIIENEWIPRNLSEEELEKAVELISGVFNEV